MHDLLYREHVFDGRVDAAAASYLSASTSLLHAKLGLNTIHFFHSLRYK